MPGDMDTNRFMMRPLIRRWNFRTEATVYEKGGSRTVEGAFG